MYYLILIPLIAGILAQIIKLIIDAFKGEFTWRDLNCYGGMPSSHTAFVIALTFSAGYFEGWESAAFAISAVLAIIVIRDAVGLRQEVGRQAQSINLHISQINSTKNYKFEVLKERIGHTWLEVLGGAAVGILIPILYIWLLI